MALLILAHIDTRHHRIVVEQVFGQCLGQFGFPDAGRSQEDERADRTARVLQSGTAAPYGVGDSLDGFVLSDHPLVQYAFHLQQFLAFALQHPAHRDAGPAGYHLRDVFGIDLFLDHRSGGVVLFDLRLQRLDLVLGFLNLSVTDFGHFPVVAAAFGRCGFQFVIVDQLLVFLYFFEQVAFALPFGAQGCTLTVQVVDLLGQLFDPPFVVLAADCLAFNLHLAHFAVQFVDLFGHRIHFEA